MALALESQVTPPSLMYVSSEPMLGAGRIEMQELIFPREVNARGYFLAKLTGAGGAAKAPRTLSVARGRGRGVFATLEKHSISKAPRARGIVLK
jgi:hypothetical protein